MTDFIEEVKELWFRETQRGWENALRFERNRIIKLLEDNWVEPMDWLTVIALIKGGVKTITKPLAFCQRERTNEQL